MHIWRSMSIGPRSSLYPVFGFLAALPSACNTANFCATSLSGSSSRMHRSGRKAGKHTGMYSVFPSGKSGLNRSPFNIMTVCPARTSRVCPAATCRMYITLRHVSQLLYTLHPLLSSLYETNNNVLNCMKSLHTELNVCVFYIQTYTVERVADLDAQRDPS